jgi:hypothetical protein
VIANPSFARNSASPLNNKTRDVTSDWLIRPKYRCFNGANHNLLIGNEADFDNEDISEQGTDRNPLACGSPK